jgi:uncharacterized OB-fold protein
MAERFSPPESEGAAPYWEATREQRLVLPWCPSCDGPFWYPREVCPRCLSPDVEWRAASGRGRVYACSTMPKPAMSGLADLVPYVVALVELDEGVRVMSNVTGCPPDDVVVGMPVQVTWEALPDGRHLPLFEPAAS